MGDNNQRDPSWAAASAWVTAFGVIFAGSQLFIMAMSTSLESVERWPHVAITYVSKNTKYIQLVVANDGTGPAVVKDVRWKIANRPFRNWNDAAVALTGSNDDIFSHSRIANQVIPANSGNFTVLNLKQTPGGSHIQQAWSSITDETRFSVCYCSSLEQSWVGKAASWIAGMPVCWIADRSQKPVPAPGGTCQPDGDSFVD